MKDRIGEIDLRMSVHPENHIIHRTQFCEQPDVLKGARKTPAGDQIRLYPCDVLAVQLDSSLPSACKFR